MPFVSWDHRCCTTPLPTVFRRLVQGLRISERALSTRERTPSILSFFAQGRSRGAAFSTAGRLGSCHSFLSEPPTLQMGAIYDTRPMVDNMRGTPHEYFTTRPGKPPSRPSPLKQMFPRLSYMRTRFAAHLLHARAIDFERYYDANFPMPKKKKENLLPITFRFVAMYFNGRKHHASVSTQIQLESV